MSEKEEASTAASQKESFEAQLAAASKADKKKLKVLK
jgi:hypothetical protein